MSPAVPGGGQRDGACFDVFDGIDGHRLFCILRAGHVGSHESEDGARWALAAPAAGADPAADGVDPAEIARQRALGWPDMHPEDFCHRCGRPNPCWFADTAEWQTATGSTGDGGGILCPSCFCALWEQVTGRTAIIWRLSIDPRSRDARPVPTPAACCGSDQPAACPDDDCAARREREELRRGLAEALWAEDLGSSELSLWERMAGTQRVYLRTADALLSGPLAAVLGRLAAAEAKVQRVDAWAAMNDDLARQYDEAAESVTTPALIAEAREHAEDCRATAEGVRNALTDEAAGR